MLEGRDDLPGQHSAVVGRRSELGSLVLKGPLLHTKSSELEQAGLAVPAPLDASVHMEDGHPTVHAARPVSTGGARGAMVVGSAVDLTWLGVARHEVAGKPVDGLRWWPWDAFERWLVDRTIEDATPIWTLNGRAETEATYPMRLERCTHPVNEETRVHVRIDDGRGAAGTNLNARVAAEGQLFTTRRVIFNEELESSLVVWLDDDRGATTGTDWLTIGGERGLARVEAADLAEPVMPTEVARRIAESGRFRLVCLTPALFSRGWVPDWLENQGGRLRGALPGRRGNSPGPIVELEAACVERPIAVSGFRLGAGAGGLEAPARRAAPAGSVWYFRLANDSGDAAGVLAERLSAWWWDSMSDDEDDRKRGFGLAAVGTGF
jgi:CRISPR-associated protein Cmr3